MGARRSSYSVQQISKSSSPGVSAPTGDASPDATHAPAEVAIVAPTYALGPAGRGVLHALPRTEPFEQSAADERVTTRAPYVPLSGPLQLQALASQPRVSLALAKYVWRIG
jgi:hypothetical protein